MEALLKDALNIGTIKKTGESGGGCINQGKTFIADNRKIFVKFNSKEESKRMFNGEYAGLQAIAATKTIDVPLPIKVIENSKGGALLVLEHLQMNTINKYSAKLGESLAQLHLHNQSLLSAACDSSMGNENYPIYVSRFGFHTTTCCGYLPQDNSWCDDWQTFFTQQRLNHQFGLIEKTYNDTEIRDLWSQLKTQIPFFFGDMQIYPSLLHGDLWSGNVAETNTGPVVFDPATFYGHHEYELAIAEMFGGFSAAFYNAYHKRIPKAHQFENRQKLYQLYHYLNHWNHFGKSYRGSCISIMKLMLKQESQ